MRLETQELAPLEQEESIAPQFDKEAAERRQKRMAEATELVWSMVRRCGLPPGWSEHDAEGEKFYYHCDSQVSVWDHPAEPVCAELIDLYLEDSLSVLEHIMRTCAQQALQARRELDTKRIL